MISASVFYLLFVMITSTSTRKENDIDADCVTAVGSVGRCTAPVECTPSYHSPEPALCRYSRGHGIRICCPLSSINNHYPYAEAEEREDFYSDDQPVDFHPEPSYSDFYPYRPPTTVNYNSKPLFTEVPNYRPHNSGSLYNRPNYNNERPSIVTDSVNPSFGYQERPISSGFQERPDRYRPNTDNYRPEPDRFRPKPAVWAISEEETPWEKSTTPQPTWSVEAGDRDPYGNTYQRISERKCEEYSRLVSQTIGVLPLSLDAEAVPLKVQQCRFSAVKLIVGGEASEVGEFPHMAAIGFQTPGSQNILWNCGGTLISDHYVMTAGHCINTTYGNPVVVRLGEYNLATENDGANPEDYRVENIIVHPNYFKTLKYNDIALIRLSRTVRFSKAIRPACLSSEDVIRGSPVATGWGRTDFVGKLSDVLMKVSLNVINNRQCNTFYTSNNPGSNSFSSGIVDTMICAGELEGGRDTCLGDSGGPLTVTKTDNPCIHYVVGITSFGKVCGAPKSPGVYTKVSKFLPWIERTVWSSST